MLEIVTSGGLFVFFAAVFGLLIGSFLNVCIYRWTRDLSVVHPRSACPACKAQIVWYDNFPLLSYVLLRGRCRRCQAKIPWTYPAVELLTAIFFAWFVLRHGVTLISLRDCVFAAMLIGLIFADLDTRLLPDEFTIGGFFIGIAFAAVVPMPPGIFSWILRGLNLGIRMSSVMEALAGGLIPALSLWLLGWGYAKLRHKDGLGFGDVKMMAMMGAFFGISGVIVTAMLGSLAGSLIGIAYIKITGRDINTYHLPFASFLGAGALALLATYGGLTGWYQYLFLGNA